MNCSIYLEGTQIKYDSPNLSRQVISSFLKASKTHHGTGNVLHIFKPWFYLPVSFNIVNKTAKRSICKAAKKSDQKSKKGTAKSVNKVEAGSIICCVRGSGVTIKGSFWQYVTVSVASFGSWTFPEMKRKWSYIKVKYQAVQTRPPAKHWCQWWGSEDTSVWCL